MQRKGRAGNDLLGGNQPSGIEIILAAASSINYLRY